ncbi:hypothetical protein CM15mP43_06120 [bacterium]|nr:MAG: hypothetical protein CM15mP43_06120 [bacterium]
MTAKEFKDSGMSSDNFDGAGTKWIGNSLKKVENIIHFLIL